MRRSRLFLFALLFPQFASASLQGHVLDSSSTTPLDSVRITLASTGSITWTNSAGAFEIGAITGVRHTATPSRDLSWNDGILRSATGSRIEIVDVGGRSVLSGFGRLDARRLPSGTYAIRCARERHLLISTRGGCRIANIAARQVSSARAAATAMDTLRVRRRGYPERAIPVGTIDSTLEIRIAWSAEQEAYDSAKIVLDRALAAVPHDTLGIDTAANLYRSYLNLWPNGLEPANARWWLSWSHYQRGRYATASTGFQSLLDSFPGSNRIDNASFYLGRCRYELGEFAGAATTFRAFAANRAFATSSYRHDATYWLGRSLFALDSFVSARAALRASLDGFPADTTLRDDATYWMGRCEYGLGASDSTRYPIARGLFLSVLATWPSSSRADNASHFVGRCWHQQHQYDSAIAWYRATARNWPAGQTLDADLHYTAVAFYDLKLYDSTIALEASLPGRFPASTYRDDAVYYAGKALYRKTLLDSAAARFDQVIAWTPASNVLDYALWYDARIRLDQGDCSAATPFIQRLRTEFPASQARTLADTYATSSGCTVP